MGTGEGAQGREYLFVDDLGLVLTWCQYAVCYQVNLYASALFCETGRINKAIACVSRVVIGQMRCQMSL